VDKSNNNGTFGVAKRKSEKKKGKKRTKNEFFVGTPSN
jgi:hypothetical protein